MSSKEERREAAARELARRNREIEESLLHDYESIDWGRAAVLSDLIKRNVIRLGGKPRPVASKRPVDCLVHGIEWPDEEYRSSTMLFQELMRKMDIHRFDQANPYEIEGAMPRCTADFRFLPAESAGSFWSGWESDFEGVDPETQYPFGADGAYFFLVSENPSDPSDPLLLAVDHEEVREAPYHPDGATVGMFLATLERAAAPSP